MCKTKIKGVFVLALCLLEFAFAFTASSQDSEKLDIYLLIGQSNMAGRATIEGSNTDSLDNVYLYTGISGRKWEKAANPLNKYSSIRKKMSMQKMGPGYHFAKKMSIQGCPIGLVVNARGGTKIEQWLPGTEFYKEAVRRTNEALEYGELKGILWHQGEANSSKPEDYTVLITALIKALRSDLDNPDLPVVVGQIAEDKPKREPFNKMLLELPAQINNLGVVKRNGTKTMDGSHFDAKSQQKLGKRYAKEMIKLNND